MTTTLIKTNPTRDLLRLPLSGYTHPTPPPPPHLEGHSNELRKAFKLLLTQKGKKRPFLAHVSPLSFSSLLWIGHVYLPGEHGCGGRPCTLGQKQDCFNPPEGSEACQVLRLRTRALLSLFFIVWGSSWQTLGDSEGQEGGLGCYSPRGRRESDTTGQLNNLTLKYLFYEIS